MKPKAFSALAGAALALALGACGDDDDEESAGTGTGTQVEEPAPAGPASQTISITETDFKIAPASVEVDEAGVVEFKVENAGEAPHALEVESDELEEETEEIPPGESATLTVELEEGTYELYCPVGDHADRGMTGELTVGGAAERRRMTPTAAPRRRAGTTPPAIRPALALAAALTAVLWAGGLPAPDRAAATELPEGFEELVLATGLDTPTAVDWAPDGRMFVIEKAGVLKVVVPARAPEATTVLDISRRVNSYGDRGLLGLAVAHNFARTGHLYLLYTYEINRRRQDGLKTSRLTRITVGPDNRVRGKERVILGKDGSKPCKHLSNTQDCIPADAPTHTIGTVRAPRDGTLWLGTGESTAYDVNFLQAFTSPRPRTFAGKLIHIDRRGRGLPNHPFCPRDQDLSHVCTKLHAGGFRNPFRFTLHRGTPIVGDVGLDTREEIDVAVAGGDFGWPCREGSIRTPAFARHPRCLRRYARERRGRPTERPLYDYMGKPGTVIVGPVFDGSSWPAQYRGRLFFGDYARRYIQTLDLDSGNPTPFAAGVGSPVAIEQSPRGHLAYVDIAAGEVREIAWSPGNRAPTAQIFANRRYGPVPMLVNFSARRSVDPEGAAALIRVGLRRRRDGDRPRRPARLHDGRQPACAPDRHRSGRPQCRRAAPRVARQHPAGGRPDRSGRGVALPRGPPARASRERERRRGRPAAPIA